MELKVMTYNLLYASHEREGRSMVYRQERADAAREVVLAEAPDLLGLTEAVYCGLDGTIIRPDYTRLFGLEHLYCAGYEGEWGSCLLSRHPIVRAERLPLGVSGRGNPVSALRAVVDCAGRALQVDLVHPSPHIFEADRVAAFAPLLASARRPYLLLGDFNSLSDEDGYERDVLVGQLRGNVPDPEALADRMLDRGLVAAVRAAGLRDTLAPADRTHTLPTRLPRPGATQGGRLRIDYIFVSPELAAARAAVIQSPAAERASDHYPVVAELSFGD